MNNSIRNKLTSRLVLETLINLILLLYFITNVAIILKFIDLYKKFTEYINIYSDVNNIVYKLALIKKELAFIYQGISIYKTFLTIIIILFIIFVISRLVTKKFNLIFKLNISFMIIITILSSLIIKILKYLEQIIETIINTDISVIDDNVKTIILNNFQRITDNRHILFFGFILITVLTFITIIINVIETLSKKDELIYKKISICIFILGIICSLFIMYRRESIIDNYFHKVDLSKAIITKFEIKNNKVIEEPIITLKPLTYEIFNKEIRSEIENIKLDYSINNREILINNIEYDEDKINLKNFIFLLKNNKIKLEKKVYVLNIKDIEKLDFETTIKFMKKYDLEYLNNKVSTEDKFMYDKYGNVYYTYSIKNYKLDYENIYNINDTSYILLPLGKIYVNKKNETIYYSQLMNNNRKHIFDNKEKMNEYIKELDLKVIE